MIDNKRECRKLLKTSDKRLAFSVNNLGSSQKNMLMIKNINNFIRQNPLLDVSVFIENIIPPCLYYNFPVYHISQAQTYEGTIVSCDFKTFLTSVKTTRPNHVYYMYDIEWKQKYHGEWHYEDEFFKKSISDVKKITRTEKYKEIIEKELGFDDIDVVNDFDIELLMEKIWPSR